MNRELLLPLFKWDEKNISYQMISGRAVRIQSNASYTDIRTDDRGRTCSVTFEDKHIIRIGDTLKLMDESFQLTFKVRYIDRVSDVNNTFILSSHKRTLSSYFVLPCLGKDREYFAFDTYFVNSYLHKVSSKKEKLKFLYLLYMFSDTLEYAELESRVRTHPMYVGNCNPDKAHIMYTFRIPDEYLEEVPLFLLGSYSRFKEATKRAIARFHGFTRNGTMWKILYKDAKLKQDMENKLKATIPDHMDLFDRPSWVHEVFSEKLKDL